MLVGCWSGGMLCLKHLALENILVQGHAAGEKKM